MFDIVNTMKTAASGMKAQGFRLRLVGENLANADTPGYHRKLVNFRAEVDRATGASRVVHGPVTLSQVDPRETFDPGHPMADAKGVRTLSNVNPLIEIADAREAQRSYQTNTQIFDQARRMFTGTLDLLRR